MKSTRKPWAKVTIGITVATLCGATAVGVATTAAAVEPNPVAHVAAKEKLAPLQEFRTPRDAGWFYTLNAHEAANAVTKNGFRKLENIGWLRTERTAGSLAVHRLRAKTGAPSYMLSTSALERVDPRFVDEGVIGYVDSKRQEGQTRLLRFSKNGQWRVFPDHPASVERMKQMGYTVDGALGWYKA